MNHRILLVPLRVVCLLLLCMLALGFYCVSAQAATDGASEPTGKPDYVIIVPLRNQAFDEAHGSIVITNLSHALHMLDYSSTPLAFIPILVDNHTNTTYQSVTDVNAKDTEKYDAILNGRIHRFSGDDMNRGIGQTIDEVIGLAKQPDRHAVVILIQAKAASPIYSKLKILLEDTTADLVLISVQEDLSEFKQHFDFLVPDTAETAANPLIRLDARVRAMAVTDDSMESSYDAFTQIFAEASGQFQLPLVADNSCLKVILPPHNVTQVMLALNNIPENSQVQITDQEGNVITPDLYYNELPGHVLCGLGDVCGELAVTVLPPQADLAAETETAAEPSGMVLFDFHCDEQLTLSTQDKQTSYNKTETIPIVIQSQGNALSDIIQKYPGVQLQLLVTDADTRQTEFPISLNQAADELPITNPIPIDQGGVYTLYAELRIGDLCTIQSNTLTIHMTNREPTILSSPVYSYWIDNPYQPTAPPIIDLPPLFSDPDGDALQYTGASDEEGPFQSDWTDDTFAQYSIQEDAVTVTPLVTSGNSTLYIKASDNNGGSVINPIRITFCSVYDALQNTRFNDPELSSNVAKHQSVIITATPQFPDIAADISSVSDTFYENANAVCCLKREDSNDPEHVSMTLDKQSGTYQAAYELPDTAAQYQVSVELQLRNPENTTLYETQSTTNPITFSSQNTAPVWIASELDADTRRIIDSGNGEAYDLTSSDSTSVNPPGSQNTVPKWLATLFGPDTRWMTDSGNGEVYELTLDFADYFTDAEDAVRGTGWHLTCQLSVTDASDQAVPLIKEPGDAIYRLADSNNASNIPAAENYLQSQNPSQITLRFLRDGQYSLHLKVTDPDDMSAEGTRTLDVRSKRTETLFSIGSTAAALLLLVCLILLVARLIKPAFGPQCLKVSLQTPAVTMAWNVPLATWKKQTVPLQWIFLYGSVPPFPAMDSILSSVWIKPHRRGIQCITRNNALSWTRENKSLRSKFVQTELDPPAVLHSSNITVEFSMDPKYNPQPNKK